MEWPGYDKDELFGFHKVVDEAEFLLLLRCSVFAEELHIHRENGARCHTNSQVSQQ